MSFVKNATAGAVLGGSLLFTVGLGMAQAQPVDSPDGLVNLSVGDVTLLESVTADTAATAASALCAEVPADVGALVTQVSFTAAISLLAAIYLLDIYATLFLLPKKQGAGDTLGAIG